jgi:hypothetical protein
MERAAQGLSNLADFIARISNDMAKWQKENPKSAEVGADVAIGGATYFGTKWTWAGILRGGPIGAAVGTMAAMKYDEDDARRAWLRKQLGIEDPKEIPPRKFGGKWAPYSETAPWPAVGENAKPMNAPWTGPNDRTAEAELKGSAEITTRITIEPSQDFLAKVKTEVSNGLRGISINGAGGGLINSNGPGSLGTSSPDAGAPSGVGH